MDILDPYAGDDAGVLGKLFQNHADFHQVVTPGGGGGGAGVCTHPPSWANYFKILQFFTTN